MMFNMTNTISDNATMTCGFWKNFKPVSLGISVRPFTRPTKSSRDLGLVNRLMTMVTPKQINQAHQARHRLLLMSEGLLLNVNNAGFNQWNLIPINMKNELPMPTINPQKAAIEVVLRQNIPNSMVAKSGAFTQLKIA